MTWPAIFGMIVKLLDSGWYPNGGSAFFLLFETEEPVETVDIVGMLFDAFLGGATRTRRRQDDIIAGLPVGWVAMASASAFCRATTARLIPACLRPTAAG